MRDVIILGGGVAGLTAGIYCMRAGLNAVLYESIATGGQAALTNEIENYPGFPSPISGAELTSLMEKQAKNLGLEIKRGKATEVSSAGGYHKCTFSSGIEESAKAIIIATGASPRKTGLQNELRLGGMGVSYCATCDGFFYRGKTVAVVGGGDTAVSDAIFLSQFCKKVYLIHRRDTLRAAKKLQERLFSIENVEIIWNSTPEDILGESRVSGIRIKNTKTQDISDIETDGIFIAIGVIPNSEIFRNMLDCDENGFIITDERMETSVKGIFAAGDIRHKPLLQIVTAAADGAVAATFAAMV